VDEERRMSASATTASAQPTSISLSTKFAEKYPLNILIAEDNPVNQTVLNMILKKLGYNATIASNGAKAIAALKEKKYELVLMDVQMPEMDGLEATTVIRTNLDYQPIVIAVTANAMQEDRELCVQAGMDDYISKPIQMDKLITLLEKWGNEIGQRTVPLP
jgi:CheY-like chemotaxis protein